MSVRNSRNVLTVPAAKKKLTANIVSKTTQSTFEKEEICLPHHSARSDQAVVLLPPDPIDDFWRRDAFGQHSHDFALDRRPDSVEDETGGFLQSCHWMKASFLVSGFHEREDFWMSMSAGHQFDDDCLQQG